MFLKLSTISLPVCIVTGLLLSSATAQEKAAKKFDPKAAALLDKYVAVTGGEAAYDAVLTRVIRGQFSMPARNVTGNMVTCIERPNKFYSEINTTVGSQRRGCNGKTVWMMEAVHGPRIIKGLERVLMIRDSTLDRFGHWRELAAKVEYAGEEEVDGKKCAKVVMTYEASDPAAKESPITIYVDLATNYIAQYTTEISRPQVLTKVTAVLDDYKKAGGVVLPHKMTLKTDNLQYVVTLSSVENNVPIPAQQFVLPREIQELLVKGK